jgi:hypothetical protein
MWLTAGLLGPCADGIFAPGACSVRLAAPSSFGQAADIPPDSGPAFSSGDSCTGDEFMLLHDVSDF